MRLALSTSISPLLKESYSLLCSHSSKWVSYTKKILNHCGLSYMWDDIHLLDPTATLSDIKNRLSDQFSQEWCSSLTETTGKLRTYKLFKSNLQIERYLILPCHLRIPMTHLRISCHQLSIKTGRYNRHQKIPLEARLCPSVKISN